MEKMGRPAARIGLLERFLARQRARMADRLIPPSHRRGRLLDIGCGGSPLFLAAVEFSEKYGLDRIAPAIRQDRFGREMRILSFDMEAGELPFDADCFDAVTLLAVLEHIRPPRVAGVLKEVLRILKPGGICILTTPAPWAEGLLRAMARLRLVSPAQIGEHQALYGWREIAEMLAAAGFSRARVRFGFFECFLNTWVTATR